MRRHRDRAQSGVIGVVLLIGLTIASLSIIVTVGGDSLDASTSQMEIQSAEHALMELDSKITLVAHGESASQSASLPHGSDSRVYVDEEAGWMNITVVNRTSGDVKEQITNVTLGAVVYENGDTEVAYQNGGVWRYHDGGSVMVSPPEVHYRGTTLTLPMISVVGEGNRGRSSVVRVSTKTEGIYPTASRHNPLTPGQVNITVQSRYYQAWATYFEDRTEGRVTVNHTHNTARLELVTPRNIPEVHDAASVTEATGTIDLAGNGAYTDSYNSSKDGGYSETKTYNGTIRTAGRLEMAGGSKIHGNVHVGDSANLDGSAFLNGSLYYTSGYTADGSSTITGTKDQISGIEGTESVTAMVRSEVDDLEGSSNDTITDKTELNGKKYYYSGLTLDEEDTLVLNTTNNPISIGIDGSLIMEKNSRIEVKGENLATIYLTGDFIGKKSTTIHVPNQTANRFWVYGTDDATLSFGEDAGSVVEGYTGVYYAPGSKATIYKAQVNGSLVAGEITLENKAALHFDQALLKEDALTGAGGAGTTRITYLHISRTNVTLED